MTTIEDIEIKVDTDATMAYELTNEGWTYFVAFTNRGARLVKHFVGIEVEPVWTVTACYAQRVAPAIDPRLDIIDLPGRGEMFSEAVDRDMAWNLMRALHSRVRDLEERRVMLSMKAGEVVTRLQERGYEVDVDERGNVTIPASPHADMGQTCTLALCWNHPPVEGDEGAEFGIEIDYPEETMQRLNDTDPTLGEGWCLMPAGLVASELVDAMLDYAAEHGAVPARKVDA